MLLTADETALTKDSVAVTPQITVIDRARLIEVEMAVGMKNSY